MQDDIKTTDAKGRRVSLKNLWLDPNNYRLIHEPEYVEVPPEQIRDKTVGRRTFRLLAGERNQNIQDLIESFRANGYLPVDQIQVRDLGDGGYVVVEGNRRIAALKHLALQHDEKGIDLGRLDPEIFRRVPVVLYEDADELHHLKLMALKHISGNKKWGEWNQAKLLQKMAREFGCSEDNIVRSIGISTVELRRSLRALSLVEQYRASDYGDQFSETKFPIFRETVRNTAVKNWLAWDDSTYQATDVQNRELFFSWLSREPVEDAEEEGSTSYGDRYLEPAIQKRDDIGLLGKILEDPRALERLRQTRDLNAAYRASDLVLQEREESAIHSVSSDIATLSRFAVRGEHLPDLEQALGRLQGIVDRAKSSTLGGVEHRPVIHDRIDRHFSFIAIDAYRKLKGLHIGTLSRINLFAGANNSGKTTLLEAIYLLSRQNDFDGLVEVIRRRGKVPKDQIDPQWLLEQMVGECRVSGDFDGNKTQVSARAFEETDTTLDRSRYLGSVEITAEYGGLAQDSLTRLYKGRDHETQAEAIRWLCPAVYSSPFFLNEPHRYTGFYHKSVQSKSLPRIFEFIREHVLPTLNDIRLVDERQRFLVDDSAFDDPLDLTSYGEGLQRIFFISLIFASAANGIVLIDEFENAIHTELIARFSGFIHTLAQTFNVQVFLTSHSKECIDAFVSQVEHPEDFSFHALVQKEEGIVAREFAGPEFARLLDIGDVDLRRAR
ncbi:AAA family ATPase [uncultured Lamprocystis sp.]|jgi:predicted ATPase|uniref:AAA family ATPase n=1 Tax=uncultured Lamprocystis sp. TaxID=543132 RepID=UPI0025CD8B32|nr:AAA family ATPase [uncultured Lamprocystis sp.]